MKADIEKIYSISQKSERKIIGLMSGTSLDGLDIALCSIEGNGGKTKLLFQNYTTLPYEEDFKKEVRKIFSVRNGDIELLTVMHSFIGKYHGQLVNNCLKQWGISSDEIDLIASHGQTIYHAPQHIHKREQYGHATLQIGDGDHLAMETGIITISDFRLKHIAAGGEGAPLAVYGDYILFGDKDENRILLNIGGIANFTWLPNEKNEASQPCFSTDVGPGNTMMDVFVQKHFGIPYDKNGELASQGIVKSELLNELLDHDFFSQSLPKTIGPELFNMHYLENRINYIKQNISAVDILATLNQLSAVAIANTIKSNIKNWKESVIYLSGGGMYNGTLVNNIKHQLDGISVKTTHNLNIHPDAKEAVLFAILANECVAGDGLHLENIIEGMPEVSMGKVSFPR